MKTLSLLSRLFHSRDFPRISFMYQSGLKHTSEDLQHFCINLIIPHREYLESSILVELFLVKDRSA